ncbi:MAG TPA: HepT-like ribonuclease domain-containing protein [Tepidisphaeraceae bacterium]|nr:HepT-like ribonuclease domain-containing protein [Tepidisphaeraceae bacterium]
MRSDRLRLQDILDAIAVISRYMPSDRATFDGDAPLQSHIYRHLMIVGEAAWSLSQPLKDANRQVPWKMIEGMRHIMVHDYFKVDWDIVFSTARDDVPRLKPQIEAILAALPPGSLVP